MVLMLLLLLLLLAQLLAPPLLLLLLLLIPSPIFPRSYIFSFFFKLQQLPPTGGLCSPVLRPPARIRGAPPSPIRILRLRLPAP